MVVEVLAPSLQDPDNLLKSIQHNLDDANDFSAHHIRLRLAKSDGPKGDADPSETVAATLRLLPGEPGSSRHAYRLQPFSRTIDALYSPAFNPASPASVSNLASFVAGALREIFSEEQQMITHLLTSAVGANGNGTTAGNTPYKPNPEVAKKLNRMVRYAPTYHITISLFTAGALPHSWDIQAAIEEGLMPLLAALEPVSKFTIDSQMQFYAKPNVVPTWDEKLQAWTLSKEDLSSFVNSAEWPLSSLNKDTTLNFVIYVPSPATTPLLIPSSPSNSFLIPQWGSILIHNPPTPPPAHLTTTHLQPLLQTFTTHLLLLLGAPSTPPSLPLPLRIDTLTRQRSAELLVSASSTLGSLARLSRALPSISIPPAVLASTRASLAALAATCGALRRGEFSAAIAHGARAGAEAERAFFERTMVAQVYFPEEHKVAVYLPLLGPVGVPLVMGGLRCLRERVGRG